MKDRTLPIDQGYAWVVVAASFCLFALTAGGFKCQGLLFLELVKQFEGVYDPSELLWVFTITYAIGCVAAFIASLIILKIGHRPTAMMGVLSLALSFIGLAFAPNLPSLLILHSLPAGFGADAVILTSLLVSGPYFNKKKALALGLIACGSGVGVLTLPYVIRLLFDHMDFSGALILYAGIHLQFVCFAVLLRPISYYTKKQTDEMNMEDKEKLMWVEPMEENGDTKNLSESNHVEEEQITPVEEKNKVEIITKQTYDWSLLVKPKFLLVLMSVIAFSMPNSVIWACIPALGKESGVDKETIAVVVLVGGGIEIPCRIANGYLADKKLISATAQYCLCLLGAGLMSLLSTLTNGVAGLVLAVVGMSSMGTPIFNLLPIVIEELIGQKHVTLGMGIQNAAQTASFIISTYITGEIYDQTGTWRCTFYYIGATMIVSSAIVWSYILFNKCRSRQLHAKENN